MLPGYFAITINTRNQASRGPAKPSVQLIVESRLDQNDRRDELLVRPEVIINPSRRNHEEEDCNGPVHICRRRVRCEWEKAHYEAQPQKAQRDHIDSVAVFAERPSAR